MVRLRNSGLATSRSTTSPSSFSTVMEVVAAPRSSPPKSIHNTPAQSAMLTGIPIFSVRGISSTSFPGLPWNQASMKTEGKSSRSATSATLIQCGESRNSSTAKLTNSTSPQDAPA